jgi:protein-S-isoprenylcysteine O-methyltransferase Ste14
MYQLELARSGRVLFRIRKSNIYVVIAIGVVVAFFSRKLGPFESAPANQAWFWVSLAVALIGALIRVYTSGHAAFGTSGKAKRQAEAAELNTTGPYSLVRNPLYVGRIVNFTGLAMLTGSWAYGALIFLISLLVYERIAVFEEEFLRGKFGEEHARWAREVPGLLPRLHGFVPPKYPFWWRRMIWREYKKFFQLASALFLYDIARRHFVPPTDPAGLFWYYVYAAVFVIRAGFSIARRRGAFDDLR